MRDPVHHYFGGGAAALNMHERVADLLLMVLSLSMESPGGCPLHVIGVLAAMTYRAHCILNREHVPLLQAHACITAHTAMSTAKYMILHRL